MAWRSSRIKKDDENLAETLATVRLLRRRDFRNGSKGCCHRPVDGAAGAPSALEVPCVPR